MTAELLVEMLPTPRARTWLYNAYFHAGTYSDLHARLVANGAVFEDLLSGTLGSGSELIENSVPPLLDLPGWVWLDDYAGDYMEKDDRNEHFDIFTWLDRLRALPDFGPVSFEELILIVLSGAVAFDTAESRFAAGRILRMLVLYMQVKVCKNLANLACLT